ncbi:MAG: hypothetical protein QOD77_2027 [Thermoplasmata archaeon]|jgi:hypothetical protein|nr:hypothetical protein [Thermoplasmata archaeon]
MDSFHEPFEWAFDGPLAEAAGLPVGILYAAVLALSHDGGRAALGHVRTALASLFGEPSRVRKGLLGTSLDYAGSPSVHVAVRGAKLRVAFGGRVKANRVREVLRALATVPGARDATVTGEVRRFAAPGSLRGPPLE